MKQLRMRVAVIAILMLALAALLAPATTSAQSYSQTVTFNVYSRTGAYIGTVTTHENRNGSVATGIWNTTGGAQGTLWAYHMSSGLVGTVTQSSPTGGQGVVSVTGPFGSLWYSMANGDRGVVFFTATSPSTNVWTIHLLGPLPPIFLTP